MAQISVTLKGDPKTVKTMLTTLAVANTINIIKKTRSSGTFAVVYTTAPGAQTITTYKGTPDGLTAAINALIAGGKTIQIVEDTFSAAEYLVVYT